MYFTPDLIQFEMGKIVTVTGTTHDTPGKTTVGHVVGFSLNSTDEVLVVVKIPVYVPPGTVCSDVVNIDVPLHPSKLKLLK